MRFISPVRRFAENPPAPPRYRCELAHVAADEEGALAVVNTAVAEFPTDYDLLKIATRTQRALEPEGWRGADDRAT